MLQAGMLAWPDVLADPFVECAGDTLVLADQDQDRRPGVVTGGPFGFQFGPHVAEDGDRGVRVFQDRFGLRAAALLAGSWAVSFGRTQAQMLK